MKLILLSLIILNNKIVFADEIGGPNCTSCQTMCNDVDNITLDIVNKTNQSILKDLMLNSESAKQGKEFVSKANDKFQDVLKARTSLSDSCLEDVCKKNKNVEFTDSNGFNIHGVNPLCDYSAPNKTMPLNSVVFSLAFNNQNIGQVYFRLSENSIALLFKAPTQWCKENEGGTFNNKVVASSESISISPDESTTKVENTSTGAQLIRKQKIIPSLEYNKETNLFDVDLGSGYKATIDPVKNTMVSNNLLSANCKGTIGRNPAKKTSRVILSPSSLNANGHKVYDTNQYKVIDAEKSKLNW